MASRSTTTSATQRSTQPPSRRGRPKAGEREARRAAILDAAVAELLELGYEKVTMLAIARRAGASKETLYSWFGNKEGLFRELIIRNADASAARVRDALDGGGDPRDTLTGYAVGLLSLLTSAESVALNRASMNSPALAAILLEHGRFRVGPIVENYLARLHDDGVIAAPRPDESFQLFYGLIMQDVQIRVLLGEAPPSKERIVDCARAGVDRFWKLSAV